MHKHACTCMCMCAVKHMHAACIRAYTSKQKFNHVIILSNLFLILICCFAGLAKLFQECLEMLPIPQSEKITMFTGSQKQKGLFLSGTDKR